MFQLQYMIEKPPSDFLTLSTMFQSRTISSRRPKYINLAHRETRRKKNLRLQSYCKILEKGLLEDESRWESNDPDQYSPVVLNSVELTVFSKDECIANSRYSDHDIDESSQFCAGAYGARDTCQVYLIFEYKSCCHSSCCRPLTC